MDIDKIVLALRSYHYDVMSEKEVMEELEGITPLDLYLADIELLDGGLKEGELHDIIKLYPKLVKDQAREMLKLLDEDHPVRTMIIEHERIHGFLFKLEELSDKMEYGSFSGVEEKFEAIVHNLDEAEKHFKREEITIFSRLERLEGGLVGRLRSLSEEHTQIRDLFHELRSSSTEYKENYKEIADDLRKLVYLLRFHSFIENDMLYPVAAKKIDDWDQVKKESESLGYCDFVKVP